MIAQLIKIHIRTRHVAPVDECTRIYRPHIKLKAIQTGRIADNRTVLPVMARSVYLRYPIRAIASARSNENLVGIRIDAVDKLLIEGSIGAGQQVTRVELLSAVIILIAYRQGNLFAGAYVDVIYKIRSSFSGRNQGILHAVDAGLVERQENSFSVQLRPSGQHNPHNH